MIGILKGTTLNLMDGVLTSIHENLGYSEIPVENIDIDEEGEYYTHYKLVGEQYVQDTDAQAIADQEAMVAQGTAIVDALVQGIIENYNSTHGVQFANINSIPKYVGQTAYTHVSFCDAIVAYNAACYDEARAIQTKVFNGEIEAPTTEDELIALLPIWGN